jgi:hypothetical protein
MKISFTALFLCFLVIQLSTSAGLLKTQSNLRLNSFLGQNTITAGNDYFYKPLRVTWAGIYWCISTNEQEKKPKIMTCNNSDSTQNWTLKSVPGGFLLITPDGKYAFDNHGQTNNQASLFLETPNQNTKSQIINLHRSPDGSFQFQFNKSVWCISYAGR